MKILKDRIATTMALLLMFAMTISTVIVPYANAQTLIMNVQNQVLLGTGNDIDLNGPTSFIANVTLWIRYPGRADFTYIVGLPTTPSGDCDYYDFDFNETGNYDLKWMVGPTSSNVVTVTAVSEIVNILPTLVYCAVGRDVIGVGQDILLYMWTNNVPVDIGEGEGLAPSPTGRQGWFQGIYIVLTKPDGTNQTFTIAASDPIGGGYVVYTPEVAGTYSIQGFFPATWKNDTRSSTNIYYEAGMSTVPVSFTVTEEQVQPWVESPIPTGYFTRPISEAARQWSPLLGDWLGSYAQVWPAGSYGGNTERFIYSKGPESAHVLWTKSLWAGGLMDNRFGDTGYQTDHYQGLKEVRDSIVIGGKIYYPYRDTAHTNQGYLCVDLYTGETLYYRNESMPSYGQVYDYESPNQHGGFPYLWRTSGVQLPKTVYLASTYDVVNLTETPVSMGRVWEMIDAYTGNTCTYVANVSASGRQVLGKDGSICYYSTARIGGQYYLRVWNTSNVQTFYGGLGSAGTIRWQWRPMGGGGGGSSVNNPVADLAVRHDIVHDGNTAWSLNVSIPDVSGYSISAVRESEYMILVDDGQNDPNGVVPGKVMALSLVPGSEGTKLWESTYTRPYSTLLAGSTRTSLSSHVSLTGVYPEDEVILFEDAQELKRWGYDMKTGTALWEVGPEPQFNYYRMLSNVYDGKLLTCGFGGVLIAYNMRTGVQEWNFTARDVGFESPYGYGYYPIQILGIADGKIYTATGEHSITQPIYRGPNLRCINASNGVELWNLLNFGGGTSSLYMVMAEDKIIGMNFFDNQIYCVGAGNSKTTVTASPEASVHGSNVMIKGTVTDDTPTGRRTSNDLVDWTLQGTPAISDEDMGRWMDYMFQQQIYPSDAKGVEVTLDAYDPNGNFVHIGTVTSDLDGNFGLAFVPDVPGTYQIIATFAGSKAYGPSFATTYIDVAEAPAASPTPTPPGESVADQYFVPGVIGIIVAIVVVGVVLILLVLRKR